MKNVLGILKGSPVVVASLVVVVACLVFLFFVVSSGGEDFRTEVAKRNSVLSEIKSLENTPFPYPDSDPDAPYLTAQTAINEVTLKELDRIHGEMHEQYKLIFDEVANYNRTGSKTGENGANLHQPMIEGLFPDNNADDVLYGGKIAYIDQVKKMLLASNGSEAMPRVNAGERHTFEYETDQLKRVEDRFLNQRLLSSASELSKADVKALWKKKRHRLEQIVTGVSSKIDLYASLDSESDAYPLHIGEWAKLGTRPNLRDLWEGQMNLWIQQDILRGIQRANDAKTDLNKKLNVTTNPVKRLISIRVAPGYVGVNSGGAMATLKTFDGLRGSDRSSGGSSRNLESKYAQAQDQAFNLSRKSLANTASKKLVEHFASQSPDKRLPDDFKTAATGRVSNKLYDVRHARLVAVVDYQQLPVLMKELAQVNFMTVLNVRISDVDEYQALREGFDYGKADAVEVDLLIETVWLRDWTKQMMPAEIKKMLAIDAEVEAEKPDNK